MKLDGDRAKSPPKRSSNPRRGAEGDAEDGLEPKSTHMEVVVKLPAAEGEIAEQVISCHDKGNPVIYGIVPEFQQHGTKGINFETQQHGNKGMRPDFQRVDTGRFEGLNDVGEGADMTDVEVCRDELALNRESSHEHVTTNWASEDVGPTTTQASSKWIRLNRMDFGLNGFTKAFNLPALGKRSSSLGIETESSSEQKDHAVNCGRFLGSVSNVSEDDISVGVVSHLCREQ